MSLTTGPFFYSNFALCALMVAVLADRKELPFIRPNFDKWMGDFSYPIYLIHYQVGLIVLISLASMGINLKRPDGVLMVISVPVIFVCAWFIARVFERPMDIIRTKIREQRTG